MDSKASRPMGGAFPGIFIKNSDKGKKKERRL